MRKAQGPEHFVGPPVTHHVDAMRTRTTAPTTARRDRGDQHSARRRAAARGEQRVREAGGPQDSALYPCDCGHVFAGDVSTHVACPRCGTEQAW